MALDLAAVARRAAEFGGEEAVATVSLRQELVVRCGPDGALVPPRRTFDLLVRLLVRDGAGRLGVARCSNSTTDAQLQVLAAHAHAQASAAQTDLRPLPDVMAGEPHDAFDPQTAELHPNQAAASARAAAAGIGMDVGRARSATWRSEAVEQVTARSGGGEAADARTGLCLTARAIDGDGRLTGYAQASAAAQDAVDPFSVGWAATPAVNWADRSGGPLLLGPREAVILLPAAVAPLVNALARAACTGHAHATGTSPFTGRFGAQVAAPGVTLADEPRLPGTLASAIDVEGVPCWPTVLIDHGTAAFLLHDSATAADAATISTGHAAELGGAPAGARPHHLALSPGLAASVDALAAAPDHTIVISAIEALRLDGPGGTRFCAVGRAAYVVDGGFPSRVLGDVLLAGDLVDLFAAVEDLTLGTELVAKLDRLPERTSATTCPAVRTRGLSVLMA